MLRPLRIACVLCFTYVIGACATTAPSSPRVENAQALPNRSGHGKLTQLGPHLYVYTSAKRSFETNTFFIEGNDSLVAVDTQFLPSAAREAIQLAEAATHKRVSLAIVLHANPDKFNGTSVFQQHGARVVTSQQVLDLIPDVFALRSRWFKARYAPDWPSETPRPSSFGDKSTNLVESGLNLQLRVLGAGCSRAHVVLLWKRHVFAGDLVANGTHAWLEIGEPEQWLKLLQEIEALKPMYVHPGRGNSGGPELLAKQRSYLQKVIELTAASQPTLPVTPSAVKALTARVIEAYPNLHYRVFLRVGMRHVYENAARHAAAVSHTNRDEGSHPAQNESKIPAQ